MDKNIQIPGEYTIRFQTATIVPAPFSHFYTLKLDIKDKNDLSVHFTITYTERDELSEDEILDEGFTGDDDYQWSGPLPAIWIREFEEIFSSSKMIRKREESEYDDFIEIELLENEKEVTIYPVDKDRWTYFLQEFMQAIFERSEREKPFELTYLEIEEGAPFSLDLKASFSAKTFTLSRPGQPARLLEWKQLQKVMDTIYRGEFLADNALSSKPSKKGKYISAGDGLWYQLGVAVVETTNKSKDLPKIEALFNNLKSQK